MGEPMIIVNTQQEFQGTMHKLYPVSAVVTRKRKTCTALGKQNNLWINTSHFPEDFIQSSLVDKIYNRIIFGHLTYNQQNNTRISSKKPQVINVII